MIRLPSSVAYPRQWLGRTAAIALLATLAACGPGGPKVKTSDNGSGSGRTAGITLVAGNVTESDAADMKGAEARFDTPRGIVIDASGNLYVADTGNYAIRKITTDGTVSTLAGLLHSSGTANGTGNRARFTQPNALAIDADGNLYVTDNYAIRKVTSAGVVTTVYTFPTGAGSAFVPAGIAVDGAGNLIVTSGVDTQRVAIANGNRVTIETGQSAHYSAGLDQVLARGVAVDANHVAYVADLVNALSRAATGDNIVSHFAGAAGVFGHADGAGNNASYGNLVAMTIDKSGNLYAADADNGTVREIMAKAVTSTVAGTTGNSATTSTGKLPGTLSNLRGITTDGNGNLYVISGNAVMKITLP